jgi:anti-sigma B factor antagonist
VSANGYPFQMVGGVPIITAPAEIDTTTLSELRAILIAWQSQGHHTVVMDLTRTQYCDSAGLRELVWAHKRAVADGGGLRLVIPADGAVLRLFTVSGLDSVIPRFATVKQALAQIPVATARPRRRSPVPEPAAAPPGLPARLRTHGGPVSDGRSCAQCGDMFAPQREHARFCSGECRTAWNREHLGDPAVEASALAWSLAAMSEATARLPALKVWDQERAFAAIGEAVWWITMVDATLVRHHQGAYDAVMAAHSRPERQQIVESLGGLRFIRNWTGRGAPLSETIDPGAGSRRITHWTWKPVGEPALAGLPPRARDWELARYRAYQACLAGHTVGETFGQAGRFLTFTGANAAATTGAGQVSPEVS